MKIKECELVTKQVEARNVCTQQQGDGVNVITN